MGPDNTSMADIPQGSETTSFPVSKPWLILCRRHCSPAPANNNNKREFFNTRSVIIRRAGTFNVDMWGYFLYLTKAVERSLHRSISNTYKWGFSDSNADPNLAGYFQLPLLPSTLRCMRVVSMDLTPATGKTASRYCLPDTMSAMQDRHMQMAFIYPAMIYIWRETFSSQVLLPKYCILEKWNRDYSHWHSRSPSTTYQANSIFSSGVDVYVAGWATDTLGYVYAAYWKNGTATYLNASFTNALPLTQQYRATSVYISGSDVYVAGYTGYDQTKGIAAAVYWKNGALTKLTDGSTRATTNSIVVSGSDVYVGGSDGIQPRLWKNGKPVNLPVSSPYGSYVLGVVVK